MHLSISAAADYLGVSVSTLRRWHKEGYFCPDYLTVGGHRRYSLTSLKSLCRENSRDEDDSLSRKTILYSRVSSNDQKEDLLRQSDRLRDYSMAQGYQNTLLIEDLGRVVST